MVTTTGIIVIFVFSMLASFAQRVCGFGFGIIVMTVLPFLASSYGEATALSGLLASVTALIPAIGKFRHVVWKKILPILVVFILASFLAVDLVSVIDGYALKHVFGIALILVSLYFIFVSDRLRLKPTVSVQLCTGTLSGLMGGLFAMQGPPAVIYFLAATDDKEEYIASTQWYFLIGNLLMSCFRAGRGFVTEEVLKSFAISVPAVFIGLLIGSLVYGKLKVGVLRKLIYAFLIVAGAVSLLS